MSLDVQMMEETARAFDIRPAAASDIPRVARLHLEALPDYFLPSLGLDFLARVYYPAAFASPFGSTLVAASASDAVGFVTIAHDTDRFTGDVLRQKVVNIAISALRAAAGRHHGAERLNVAERLRVLFARLAFDDAIEAWHHCIDGAIERNQ